MSARSTRSRSKVSSRLRDFGHVRVVAHRRIVAAEALDPQARSDAGTEVARPARGGRSAASSATVVMPSAARRWAVRSPMPQIAVTGRSPIVGSHSARVSVAMPPGLANPVAVLAWSFVSPMPTAHDSCVASRTAAPARRGPARWGSVGRVPRNASSHPSTSTTTGSDRSVAITSAEAAS